jgi:hypothetical protein
MMIRSDPKRTRTYDKFIMKLYMTEAETRKALMRLPPLVGQKMGQVKV